MDLNPDFSTTFDGAQDELLTSAAFPDLSDGLAGMSGSPEDMQRQDPLAAQVWRFFTKTKQQLPNQERMENLTWRMMAMNLRRRRQEEAAR
jgi:GATA-binding protein